MLAGNSFGDVVDFDKTGIVVDYDMGENLMNSDWNWECKTEHYMDVEMIT